MKRRRPEWQSACRILTLVVSGTALMVYSCASGQAYDGDLLGRRLLTVPPLLQPIPPPQEVNVSSVPTFSPIDPDCGGGGGCPPPVSETQPEPTDIPPMTTRKPMKPETMTPTNPSVPPPTDPAVPKTTPPPPMPETPRPVESPAPPPVEPSSPPPVPPPVEPHTPQPVEPPMPPTEERTPPPPPPPPVEPPTEQPIAPPVAARPVESQPGAESPVASPVEFPQPTPVEEPPMPRPVDGLPQPGVESPVATPMEFQPSQPVMDSQPTLQPVEPRMPAPVEPETPEPVELPTAVPVEPPTREPTFAPTLEPTIAPTREPTIAPVAPTPVPVVATTVPPSAVPSMNTPPTASGPVMPPSLPQPLTKPPTSTVEEVPIAPFVLSLGFSEPQSGTTQDLEVLTSEVNRILSDYLYNALNESITDENVVLEDVVLTVIPQLGRSDNFSERRRALRALQENTINFMVSGNAIYEVGGDSDVTTQELTQQTNEAVATTMEDPQTQQDLTEEFQASEDSEALSNTSTVSAQVEAPRSDDGNNKPTTVAIVFGWLLVALGAVGIALYASTFIKKRRKRARQRRRDRERGLTDNFNNASNVTASMASMNGSSVRVPSAESKVMVLPPTEYGSGSDSASGSASPANSVVSPASSSAASAEASTVSSTFSGLDSEASTKSDFTRELELAASLDKRSWSEMQKERKVLEEQSRSIQYPSQYAVEGAGTTRGVEADENAVGAAAVGVTTAAVAAAAITSYPYGDEKGDDDDSEARKAAVDGLFDEDEDGIEWTAEGVWSPYDGYQKREPPPDQSGSLSSVSDSRSDKQRSVWAKSWSSIDSFRRSRKRGPRDSNAFMKSWSSIDSAREGATQQHTLRNISDGSTVEDTAVEEVVVEEAIAHAAVAEKIETRAVDTTPTLETAPTVSSAGTTNAVRASPPPTVETAPTDSSAGTATAVHASPPPSVIPAAEVDLNEKTMSVVPAAEVVVSEKAVVEENKNDDDSVLTQDIVKEVHRLARFVRKYDRKRERKLLKDREREEKDALAINEAQSIPSVSYDAMSDSISALRKGPVETSPRQERTALENPLEETDESVDSERSWSTTSNANAPFDDKDDASAPMSIDDSEIDVSDSSVGEPSETESNASRLGINPYSVQRVIARPQSANPVHQAKRVEVSSPETARPPVSRQENKSRGLPPLSTRAGSPDEISPEKTHTPVQSVKKAMMRVNSARQEMFGQKKNIRKQQPTMQSRDGGLTEDALQDLANGEVEFGLSSPYRQRKGGALATLRKNQAILDTASSHFTDGVTSSQYEQAFKEGVVTQQERRRAYLKRNSFRKLAQRAPQDPPAQVAESMSLQATDEKRSPPWESKSQEAAVENRVPPTQPPPAHTSSAMPAASLSPSASMTRSAQPPPPSQRKAPFRVKSATTPPSQLRSSLSPVSTSSGTKRAAPEAAPEPQTPGGGQESATVPVSPAIHSPPRRKSKRGSAFDNVVNMFEQKPKNAIFPPGEGWQYSY